MKHAGFVWGLVSIGALVTACGSSNSSGGTAGSGGTAAGGGGSGGTGAVATGGASGGTATGGSAGAGATGGAGGSAGAGASGGSGGAGGGASGACTNSGDQAILNSIDVETTVGDCGQTNLGAEPATYDCIKQATNLSDGCVTCFDATIACAVQNCLIQCLGDSNAPACVDCRKQFCDPAFEACSGLSAT